MLRRGDSTGKPGKHHRRSVCILLSLALGACSSLQPAGLLFAERDLPRYAAPSSKRAPRVALVLSGGSARGFAHLGVLRVLERERSEEHTSELQSL